MSYSIFWTDRSRKDLEKLSGTLSKRIVDKIESLSENPYRTAERCEGYPYFHQRIGNYRVILDISDSGSEITILKVGPRKKVYDR